MNNRFEQIKQAIEVEVKHCYINIQGKMANFNGIF